MPPPTRRPGALTTLVALLAVVLAACTSGQPVDDGPDAPTGHWRWTPQADRLQLGVTHTRKSLDPHHPDGARDRGLAILEDGAVWQNHHLMGFGTLNPQPAPGEYDWESLDRRMRLTEDTGARTVLTLCCAPDWMKGGAPGATDWSRLEDDPLPAHFADFAALAAAAVQRYPQVERVLVWNELKGFYRSDLNRWDQEGYTALYNEVYRAVKAARPDVKVGGPYVVLSSLDAGRPNASDLRGPWGAIDSRALAVVDHWLAHKAGADFVAVDGNTKTREGTRPVNVDVGARSTPPSTGGCGPARTCRSGGPSSTRTCPTASRPARRARRPPPPRWQRWPPTRRRARGRRCCGARRPTTSPTPPCGPTAPSPAAAARPVDGGLAVAGAAARRRPGAGGPVAGPVGGGVPRRRRPGAREPDRRAGGPGRGRGGAAGLGHRRAGRRL